MGSQLTLSHDLARQVAEFNQSLADRFTKDDERGAGLKVAYVRATVGGSRLAMYEEAIKKSVRELSLLTWDSIQHSPRGDLTRDFRFRMT